MHVPNWKRWVTLLGLLTWVPTAPATPPANDACVDAEIIGGLGLTTLIADVSEATIEGDPISSCLETTHRIWFQFTPTITAGYTISTAGDTGTTVEDPVLSVYTSTGGCAGPFEEVDCNDDEAGLRAALSVTLAAGVTYYIVVGVGLIELSPEATAVQLRLSIPVPPQNDFCSGAEVIPSDAMFPYFTQVTDTTLAGSEEDPVPTCSPLIARTVWYEFTPMETSIYEFSTCEDTATTVFDTMLAVYTSTNGCSGPMTEVACDKMGCGTRASLAAFLEASRSYYIVAGESFPDEPEPVILGETSIQLKVVRFLPPQVTTSASSGIFSGGAQLNAVVDPGGAQTVMWFEWGSTTNYGTTTPIQPVGSVSFPVARSAPISVPGPDTYHYRAVATNALGTSYGADQAFRWSDAEPLLLAVGTVGQFRQIRMEGVSRQIYWIEASGNLRTWILLGAAVETTTGVFEFEDGGSAGLPLRFYRGLAP